MEQVLSATVNTVVRSTRFEYLNKSTSNYLKFECLKFYLSTLSSKSTFPKVYLSKNKKVFDLKSTFRVKS